MVARLVPRARSTPMRGAPLYHRKAQGVEDQEGADHQRQQGQRFQVGPECGGEIPQRPFAILGHGELDPGRAAPRSTVASMPVALGAFGDHQIDAVQASRWHHGGQRIPLQPFLGRGEIGDDHLVEAPTHQLVGDRDHTHQFSVHHDSHRPAARKRSPLARPSRDGGGG